MNLVTCIELIIFSYLGTISCNRPTLRKRICVFSRCHKPVKPVQLRMIRVLGPRRKEIKTVVTFYKSTHSTELKFRSVQIYLSKEESSLLKVR